MQIIWFLLWNLFGQCPKVLTSASTPRSSTTTAKEGLHDSHDSPNSHKCILLGENMMNVAVGHAVCWAKVTFIAGKKKNFGSYKCHPKVWGVKMSITYICQPKWFSQSALNAYLASLKVSLSSRQILFTQSSIIWLDIEFWWWWMTKDI